MDNCPESLEAPYVYMSKNENRWIVFPNSNPDPFKHPKACIDSILSTCPKNKTLEECINLCGSDDKCEFGYFVEGENSICLPLYTSDYYPEASPLLSMKNKKCFPETRPDGVKTYSFMKSSKKDWLKIEETEDDEQASWPVLGRSTANAVFMGDKVLISVKINGKTKHVKMNGKKLVLDDEGTEFQIFNKYGISRDILTDKVNFYNTVSFILGDTKSAVILEARDGAVIAENHYNWVQDQDTQTFQIIPVRSGELCGETQTKCVVSYGDEFFLSRSGGFVGEGIEDLFNILYASESGISIFDDQHHPTENVPKSILVRNLSDLSKNTPDGAKFFFTPTKTVYYCESDKKNSCKPIKLNNKNVKIDKQSAVFNGKPLFLRSDCFGSCEWSQKSPVITNVLSSSNNKQTKSSDDKTIDWNSWTLIFSIVAVIAMLILVVT